mmetsp:Transcript_26611/g.39424  ORF Transcript_26611/g.39424 Transcript_26611/m.39424 type:complete len:81 (-) Transcript_26611:183-425(-)
MWSNMYQRIDQPAAALIAFLQSAPCQQVLHHQFASHVEYLQWHFMRGMTRSSAQSINPFKPCKLHPPKTFIEHTEELQIT